MSMETSDLESRAEVTLMVVSFKACDMLTLSTASRTLTDVTVLQTLYGIACDQTLN